MQAARTPHLLAEAEGVGAAHGELVGLGAQVREPLLRRRQLRRQLAVPRLGLLEASGGVALAPLLRIRRERGGGGGEGGKG